MSEAENSSRTTNLDILYWLIVALCLGAFAFQLIYHSVRAHATIDEPVHILAGHKHLQCGDFGINPEHPPMAKMLAALPLAFPPKLEPPWDCGSRNTPKLDSYTFGNRFVAQNGVDEVVISTRLSIALLSLFLAALVFFAAREMFGHFEALVALAILAFEPSLIAHGSQVTTDMALTATAFAAVYATYRFRNRQTWFRLIISGLSFGLLFAAKHSAVVFFPILLVLLLTDALIYRKKENGGLMRILLRQTAFYAAMFLIGFAILWAFYGFRYRAVPNASVEQISIAAYIKENGRPEMIESFPAKITDRINRLHLFPESYVLGMADVIAWGSRSSFLFGKSYPTGKWFYFPLAFSVKSSIALLLLLSVGFVAAYFLRDKRREMLYMLLPPLAFFVVAMNSSMTIGIRHVLPIYGFLIVAAAVGAVWLCRKFYNFRFVLIILLMFHALTAVRIAPDYLAFANDFWGGVDKTHLIFNDSNVDTGQSVKLAREYLVRENITDCWFAAFGHVELIKHTQPCRPLPSALRILLSQDLIEPVPPVIEGTILVSVNELPPRGGDEYVPLLKSQPVALIGGNILVYQGRFEVPLAAAMSHAYRSGQFLRLGQTENAIAEGEKAVALGGEDPRPHIALGVALVRVGQKDAARAEFQKALELARKNIGTFRTQEVRAALELERLDGNNEK
ncbi:MAG TPA: phospholipid carrier-dependent glycosyltransferase [Pyrinomonadaceae bacterium]|nr:phospholipid carrier-dependent glycosyltransferase [Pyrinomonadaceae bacterium]